MEIHHECHLENCPKLFVMAIWFGSAAQEAASEKSYNMQQFTIYCILGNFPEKLILDKLNALSFR